MHRIVVGLDGSEGARAALEWALAEARLRNAHLEVVYVWHTPFGPTWGTMGIDVAEYETAAQRLVDDELASRTQAGEAVPIEAHALHGFPAQVLIERSDGADLLVVGARGAGGFPGLHLGSVSHQVAQHAKCPVVVVPSSP
jgi:nucleotide-binding universal stress UspA family protein